jgi:hypothetical protein
MSRVFLSASVLALLLVPSVLWAQFGGRNPRYNDGEYYPNNDRPQDQIGPAILEGLIRGAAELERAERERQRREDYYDRQPRRYDYIPQQRYIPAQPVQPKATLKSNPPPKKVEKLVKAAKNAAPNFGAGLGLTDAEHDLLTQVAKDKTTAEIGKLEMMLGPAAMDPKVKEELAKLKEKADKGEEITTADIDKLAMVAMMSGMLPAGFNPADANKQADQLKKWSQIASSLQDEANTGPPTLPGGNVVVISVPTLPQDDMVMLPDGTILIGTGGQGLVNVASLNASDVLGVSIGAGEPIPDSESDVTKRVKEGTLLLNPQENDATIEYVISGANYSMKAGYTHALPAGTKWIIRFDRGNGSEASYTLADGTYAFGSSEKGWELYPQKFSVTIDNRGNDSTFHYNVDNKQHEVAAGSSETHNSSYPIYISFDRGNGQEALKKVLTKDQHFQVAVDPSDSLWELYAGDRSQVADASAGPKAEDRSSKARSARLRALLQETSARE